MAFELKDGQGSLFQDTSERKKDYNGKCMIGGQMYWISGWKKIGRNGKSPWLSLAFEPAEQRQSEPEF
jgi:hypothetical protein